MGFNKRYFSMKSIIEKARQSDFNEFDSWLYKPDACVFEVGDGSIEFYTSYMGAEEKEQFHIYYNLKNGK